MPYYNHVNGNLYPGLLAESEDIHHIQYNIEDAIKAVIEDQYDHTAFILGDRENAFILSPAPKRLNRYIDNMNVSTDANKIWLDINSTGYRQALKTSKTSLYSVIVQLKNTYSQDQDVVFELWSEDAKISKQTITVPAKTNSSEFEIVFNLEHFSTKHGRDGIELEKPDAPFILHPGEERFEEDLDPDLTPDSQSLGSTVLYLVVKAIHKETEIITSAEDTELITNETFMILADTQGNYGQLLEKTNDDGRNYETTEYDLVFKSIYSNAPTYLCTGGQAVVHGEPVVCQDTHVVVEGASTSGDTKTYVFMDRFGQLRSYTSDAYNGDDSKVVIDKFPAGDLLIAIIYTYNADTRQPKIIQDDTYLEKETNLLVRQRSHHERLRRLEKEMAYQRDIAIPSRLKYNLTGEDLVDTASTADNASIATTELNNGNVTPNAQNIAAGKKAVDWSQYYISTDMYGNYVVKSVNAETIQIPVTLKESADTSDKTGIKLAQTIVSTSNADVDRANGIATIAEHKTQTTQNKTNKYKVGLTSKEAKETEFNPWDDRPGNRPETANITPTTRSFTTHKGVNGVNVRSSEYPGMTLYLPHSITLTELVLPIVKFKNVATVQFHIFKRQGPNNKTNTVWLEKLVYSSKKFSLKNAKTKKGYQILDEPFSIKPKNGLKLDKHQYVIVVQIVPKSGDGTVYVETYKPKDSTDFLIRYHGSADCAHFRLKERYREIWYTSSANSQVKIKAYENEYYKTGRIESGEVIWENSEPIQSITPYINSVIPTGCSIKLEANAGSGWVTLQDKQATTITGGTSSFKWRATLTGNTKTTPQIIYDADKKYAINFSITKKAPHVGGSAAGTGIPEDKNVITTKTFYPGDILRKYIGDDNFHSCDKFSNYEWIRVFGSNSDAATALIDIAASDNRIKFENNTVTTIASNACEPAANEYDIFSLYYADLSFDDFTQDSVDYSNYDNNIEYDEHNLRFKIDTDRAYNDDDIALFTTSNAEWFVKEYDESQVQTDEETGIKTDNNPPISIRPDSQYLTVVLKDFSTTANNAYADDNRFIWKYTMPGDSTIDLSNYSALKIGYGFNNHDDNVENATVDGLALYISSAIEEECPSNNGDIETLISDGTLLGKTIVEYDKIAPDELTTAEMESYKDKVLKVRRERNGITYTEYYYYTPDENGIWKKHQYHNLKSFSIFSLPTLNSDLKLNTSNPNYFMISIDAENDNFKYVKEIGLIALSNPEKAEGINFTGTSTLEVKDIKGVVKGFNTIYTPNNQNIVLADNQYVKKGSEGGHYQTTLFRDATNQVSSLTRIYYNQLNKNGEMIGYVNNDSITKDANNFAIQFASDTYLPKDSLHINLCTQRNGVDPIFTLNMPTLNQVYWDKNLEASNLFDATTEYANKLKTTSNGNVTESSSAYSITNKITPVLPQGVKESDCTVKEYKITIEPAKTTLDIDNNTLEWNVYKQEVTKKSNGTEKYGDKQLIDKIYVNSGNVSSQGKTDTITLSNSDKKIPQLLININNITYKTHTDAGQSVLANTSTVGNYNAKFAYEPGSYKVKIGFQGYTAYQQGNNGTNKTLYKYRSAENEFIVNIFWRISNAVNFSQIYKKISEDKEIQSLSITTTDKFKDYMNTIKNTQSTNINSAIHIFIKNITLYEAEHIPLFHPNMRMKIYSRSSDGEASVNIRKIGAVLEYK